MKGIYFHLQCVLIANRITFIGWRIEVIAGEYFYCDIKKNLARHIFSHTKTNKTIWQNVHFFAMKKNMESLPMDSKCLHVSQTHSLRKMFISQPYCIWSIFSYKQGHLAGQTFRIDICRSWYPIVLHVCKPSQGNLQ
mgnify:CR=1 FL=1